MKRSFLLCAAFAATQIILPAAENESETGSGVHRSVSSREIEQLHQQISDSSRSSVEAIGEYHTESGDINNRLDFLRFGGRFNYRPGGGTTYYIRAAETQYKTIGNYLNQNGFNATGGVKTSLSDSVTLQVEGGGTRFSTSASTVNAMGTLRYKTSGGSEIYGTGSRSNVEETLLSATGIMAAGKLTGLVMDNRAVGGARYQVTPRFDLFAEGGAGTRQGRNIESNPFRAANGGAGYNLLSRGDDSALSLVRASYSLDYFGFDKDLFGFSGLSAGGYFSPHDYVANVGRIEMQGRPHQAFEYRVSAFMGSQDYTGSPLRQASGFSGTATFHLGDRYSVPVTYVRDNFGPFTQQSLFFRLIARL